MHSVVHQSNEKMVQNYTRMILTEYIAQHFEVFQDIRREWLSNLLCNPQVRDKMIRSTTKMSM